MDDLDVGLEASLREAADTPPVVVVDLTELLQAWLVALRLPPDTKAYKLPSVPFWSISDAGAHIAQLEGLPDGARLEAFVPAIGASTSRPLRFRAAVASTFVAGLKLTRDGVSLWIRRSPGTPSTCSAALIATDSATTMVAAAEDL
jgi:hypothetical protein